MVYKVVRAILWLPTIILITPVAIVFLVGVLIHIVSVSKTYEEFKARFERI